jgi:hypothetical protein
MKKKIFFWILLAIVATVSSYAQNQPYVTQDGFVYIDHYKFNTDFTVSGGVWILDYTGSSKIISIPPSLMGEPPSVIDQEAFFDKQLTSVTIPNGMKIIGKGAFHTNFLTTIIIPDSVTEIAMGAFMHNRLTNVTIGRGVTSIEEVAFYNNPITSITIGAGVNIAENAFFGFNDEDGYSYPSNFVEFYNKQGRLSGTYTRSNARSTNWTRR